MQAISVALREFPSVNASLAPGGQDLLLHSAHSFGVAMDTPGGLVVPNVKNVQLLSIPDIAAELARLQVAFTPTTALSISRSWLVPGCDPGSDCYDLLSAGSSSCWQSTSG